MERTQIYFDKTEKENLKKVAEKKGKTMAEVVCEAVSEYLVKEQGPILDKLADTSGIWKDRDEIVDSDSFVNEMRNKWSRERGICSEVNFLLDTNILIAHLRGKPTATYFLRSLIIDEAKPVCSIITRIELLAGMRSDEDDKIKSLLQMFEEAPVDHSIADIASEYMMNYMKSHGLTTADAIIAATAKKLGCTLCTLNVKRFPMEDIKIKAPY